MMSLAESSEATFLEYLVSLLILGAVLALAGCSKEKTPPEKGAASSGPAEVLNAPREYSGALVEAHRAAKRAKAKAEMRQLLEVFRAEHERYPKSLDEMRQMGYEVPPPPKKMKYVYNPSDGSITVVPEDGR